MLKLSTRGRYGLRAMIDLGHVHGQGALQMSAMAKNNDFSRKYLHALLTSLKDAGLVQSIRGARGGYCLAKNPSEIYISEIFEALEGPMAIVDCLLDAGTCARTDCCQSRSFWSKLNNVMTDILTKTTLADLLKDGIPQQPAK